MAATVSHRLKRASDYGLNGYSNPRTPSRSELSIKPQAKVYHLQSESTHSPAVDDSTSLEKTRELSNSFYKQNGSSGPGIYLSHNYAPLPMGSQQCRNLPEEPTTLLKPRRVSGSEANIHEFSQNINNLSENGKPTIKESSFSYNLNKQIREKFKLKLIDQDSPEFLEQLSSQRSNRAEQLFFHHHSDTMNAKAVRVQRKSLSAINKAVKTLNDKVNKLYSWQISELDLVGKLAGEVQTMKQSMSSSASTRFLHSKSNAESIISTKLGRVMLKSLSESLHKLATETNSIQETCEDSTLSPDNLDLIKNKITKLSRSLEPMVSYKVEAPNVKNLKNIENFNKTIRPSAVPRASKTFRFVTGESSKITTRDKLKSQHEDNFNNCLIPHILDGVGKSVLKPTINFPLQTSPKQEVSNSVQTILQPASKIPANVKYEMSELNDEIVTARITLQHMVELAVNLEGPNLQRFRDFVAMTEKSDMLQPYELPDVLENWLPSATSSQVGVVREQINLLQVIKQSILNFVDENDLDVINERRLAIEKSGLIDQPLLLSNASEG